MKKKKLSTKKTEIQKDVWMQIQRWLKYWITCISSSEFSFAALTLTVGSLFRWSKGFVWIIKAEDILRYRHLSFFRLKCTVVVLLVSWQCLFHLFLKSLGLTSLFLLYSKNILSSDAVECGTQQIWSSNHNVFHNPNYLSHLWWHANNTGKIRDI